MIAAIYARKSTEQNGVSDEAKSVTRQVEQAKAYAARKGWTVLDECVYADDGISGAEFATRPGYVRLMNALKPRPPFNVLIMSEESRLGREQIEVAYALKQIVTAGVEVWLYLEDRERTLNSPIEKAMLAMQTMSDEMEHEKARQRVTDTMTRKARAGQVTGGRVFGYDNVEVVGADGRRSHVEHRVSEAEAPVVRRIFELCARGLGKAKIAALLNDEGAPCPRSQQRRPRGWAASSVHAVLYRDRYRGVLTYGKTKKRDKWGQKRRIDRPEAEWVRVDAPTLRIVSEELWGAAHKRLDESRLLYLRGTKGRLCGRPLSGVEAKYLLTGLAQCPRCGGTLEVRTRAHGRHRAYFYTCSTFRRRGASVCDNREWMPLPEADRAVLDVCKAEILDREVVGLAIDRAVDALTGDRADVEAARAGRGERLRAVEGEIANLTAALAAGGDLPSIIGALRDREATRARLGREVEALAEARAVTADVAELRTQAEALVDNWRELLLGNVAQARQVLKRLLRSRLTFTRERRGDVDGYWFEGEGSVKALVLGVIPRAQAVASPTGHEMHWRRVVYLVLCAA